MVRANVEWLQNKPYGITFFLATYDFHQHRFVAKLPDILRSWPEISQFEALS
jgi:hypothetical protein